MKKQRIKELETRLRIIRSHIFTLRRSDGFSYHARYNHIVAEYKDIVKELETISLKYKIKKLFRRITKWHL